MRGHSRGKRIDNSSIIGRKGKKITSIDKNERQRGRLGRQKKLVNKEKGIAYKEWTLHRFYKN